MAAQTEFHLILPGSGTSFCPFLRGDIDIIGMHHRGPPVASQLLRAHAAIGKHLIIEPVERSIGTRRPDVVRHRLRKRPEPFLAFKNTFLSSFADGDVKKKGGETFRPYLAGMRLIPAVSQCRDVDLELPGLSGVDDLSIRGDQFVLNAWYRFAHRLSDRLGGNQPRLSLECRVDVDKDKVYDPTFGVPHHLGGEEAFMHLLEQPAPALFALLQRDFRLLAVGDVESDSDEASPAAAFTGYHLASPCDPTGVPVFGSIRRYSAYSSGLLCPSRAGPETARSSG